PAMMRRWPCSNVAILVSQAHPQESDHDIAVVKLAKLILYAGQFAHDSLARGWKHILEYLKRIAQAFRRDAHIVQLARIIRRVCGVFPAVKIFEPRLCDQTRIGGERC